MPHGLVWLRNAIDLISARSAPRLTTTPTTELLLFRNVTQIESTREKQTKKNTEATRKHWGNSQNFPHSLILHISVHILRPHGLILYLIRQHGRESRTSNVSRLTASRS